MNSVDSHLFAISTAVFVSKQKGTPIEKIIQELNLNNADLEEAIRVGSSVVDGKVVELANVKKSACLRLFLQIIGHIPVRERGKILSNIVIDNEDDALIIDLIRNGSYQIFINKVSLTEYLCRDDKQELLRKILFELHLLPFPACEIPTEVIGRHLNCQPSLLAIMRSLHERGFPVNKYAFVFLSSTVFKKKYDEFLLIWNEWKEACLNSFTVDILNQWLVRKNNRYLNVLFQEKRFLFHTQHMHWDVFHSPHYGNILLKLPPPNSSSNHNYYMRITAKFLFHIHINMTMRNEIIRKWSLNEPDWLKNVKPGDFADHDFPPFTKRGFSYLWQTYPETRPYLMQYKCYAFKEMTDNEVKEGIFNNTISAKELMRYHPAYCPDEGELIKMLPEVCALANLQTRQVQWVMVHFSHLMSQNVKDYYHRQFFSFQWHLIDEGLCSHLKNNLLHTLFTRYALNDENLQKIQEIFPSEHPLWHTTNSEGCAAITYAYLMGIFPIISKEHSYSALIYALESSHVIPWNKILQHLPVRDLKSFLDVSCESTAYHIIHQGMLTNFEAWGYTLTKEAAQFVDHLGHSALTAALAQQSLELVERLLDLGAKVQKIDCDLIGQGQWQDFMLAKFVRANYCPYQVYSFSSSSYEGLPEFFKEVLHKTKVYHEIDSRPLTYADWITLASTAENPLHRFELHALFDKKPDSDVLRDLTAKDAADLFLTSCSFMQTCLFFSLLQARFNPVTLEVDDQVLWNIDITDKSKLSEEVSEDVIHSGITILKQRMPPDLHPAFSQILRKAYNFSDIKETTLVKLAMIGHGHPDLWKFELHLLALEDNSGLREQLAWQRMVLSKRFICDYPDTSLDRFAKQLAIPGYEQSVEPIDEESEIIDHLLPQFKKMYMHQMHAPSEVHLEFFYYLLKNGEIEEAVPGFLEVLSARKPTPPAKRARVD